MNRATKPFVLSPSKDERELAVGRMVKLLLCGDVMLGRGIDQILPHPSPPRLYEPYVRDAGEYVRLAESGGEPLPRAVDFAYVWGDALAELEKAAPDLRLINLETSITKSEDYWKGKDIHYRMNPENVACLTAAGIDCCVLANNHVLDWGVGGLIETLSVLERNGIKYTGAGRTQSEAETPAVFDLGGGSRALVFAFGSETSGVPEDWAAADDRPGVNYLPDFSPATIERVTSRILAAKRPGDIVIVSVHWGGNWGYDIPEEHLAFAHSLIDAGAADIIHGHSSHHAKGIEVYRDRLILYGCGDFLNDYEGISGYETFRADLGFMYFPEIGPTGKLLTLSLIPTQIKRFRVNRAAAADAEWLAAMLNHEGRALGTSVELSADGNLRLRWSRNHGF